jgi:chromosomal replication initiation ATPase DnaA
MNWIKIDECEDVQVVLRNAVKEIEEITGRQVKLQCDQVVSDTHLQVLKDIISEHFGVKWEDVLRKDRSQNVKDARHVAGYLLRHVFHMHLREVAALIGLNDHTSVVHLTRKIKGYYKVGDRLVMDIETIKSKLLKHDNSN